MQILKERGKVHGNWEAQALHSQRMKDRARLSGGWHKLSDQQKEALDSIFVKISRILVGDPNHKDHWIDIAGYATLAHNNIKITRRRK